MNTAICISFAGLVSSGHHIYGAIIYETPWRIGVSLWIPGIACLILSMLYLLWKYPGTLVADLAAWIVLVGGVIFQSGFTMFECVYSHVLKIILFVVDTPQNILELLYPAPAYHLPDNIVFELTG
ncbi:MAG: hypothetical protein KJN90_15025, partial [Gammaproteobacteria bacterium]|nr:hypothetical protein [Gammaproteobacteria bacterium]